MEIDNAVISCGNVIVTLIRKMEAINNSNLLDQIRYSLTVLKLRWNEALVNLRMKLFILGIVNTRAPLQSA